MKKYTPVTAEPHTPPYKIHRYFARRPWNVFENLVQSFSDEGDIILDPFCGGGVTIYEGLRLKRRVIGFDLNPLSILIVKNMVKNKFNAKELTESLNNILSYIDFLYGDYNKVEPESKQRTLSSKKTDILWSELALTVECSSCGNKVVLSNENKIKNGYYSCANKKCDANKSNGGHIEPKDCKRIGYDYLFSVYKSPLDKTHLNINFDEKRLKTVQEHILFLKNELKKNKIEIQYDEIPINWDRQHEDLLLRKNIKYFQDLFTERNLLINTLLLNYIKNLKISKESYEILRMAFSSSLRDTNIMAFTHDGWQAGKPTTWSKHAYWVPNQFCEVDIKSSFEKAYNRVKESLNHNLDQKYDLDYAVSPKDMTQSKNILLINNSINESHIPSEFVDAIITDPPYGSNVQYLELSHFWYVWNKDLYDQTVPDFSKEAISNRKKNFKGAKDMNQYEKNLYSVFQNCFRSLKQEKYMVLTFNNKDMGAWLALLISIFRSGFTFEDNGLYFQDGVENYKQTAHTKYEGSPFGDFIYVFKKSKSKKANLIKKISEETFVRDIDALFKRYISSFKTTKKDKNELIREMFLEAVPKIEEYVKSDLSMETKSLYQHFGKNYLNKLYG